MLSNAVSNARSKLDEHIVYTERKQVSYIALSAAPFYAAITHAQVLDALVWLDAFA
jgi:hypothetical protein